MPVILKVLNVLRKLPAPLVSIVHDIVVAIASAPDKGAAARAAYEAARSHAMDEAGKKEFG
jgi:hypothetical protein